MLFGTYKEPTHYVNLFAGGINIKNKLQTIYSAEIHKDKLCEELLKSIDLNFNDFCSYHKQMVDYRNRYLSHREHHPDRINDGDLTFSCLDIVKQTFLSIFFILIQILREYPNNRSEKNNFLCNYQNFS